MDLYFWTWEFESWELRIIKDDFYCNPFPFFTNSVEWASLLYPNLSSANTSSKALLSLCWDWEWESDFDSSSCSEIYSSFWSPNNLPFICISLTCLDKRLPSWWSLETLLFGSFLLPEVLSTFCLANWVFLRSRSRCLWIFVFWL